MKFKELNVPNRTIMTPGPVESHPVVLRAMSTATLGQFDPAFTSLMQEIKEMLRIAFNAPDHETLAVDGSSRSGLEAALFAMIEEGDKVLIPAYGRFAYLLAEIAGRAGAEVVMMETEWTGTFDQADVIEKIKEEKPKIVAMIHGETANGQSQDLAEIGAYCQENDIYFVVDCVATFGGVKIEQEAWGIDIAIAGTQKCLSVPAGMSLVSMSPRAKDYIQGRYQKELGLGDDQRNDRFIQSNYLDLSQLMVYWSPNPINHHTEATNMVYALHTGLRLFVQEEGMDAVFARHQKNYEALVAGITAMGLDLYGDRETAMPTVVPVMIPEGVEPNRVREVLLNEFSVEIAGSFGDLNSVIWRIGNMGYSSRKDNVLHVLAAFEAALIYCGVDIPAGQAVQAALEVYSD